MSSRQAHDGPATLIAASIGVVLLLVGVSLTLFETNREAGDGQEFRVTWSQTAGTVKSASAGGSATVSIAAGLVAAVSVTSTACTDSADTPQGSLQNPASITITVKRKVGTQTVNVRAPVTYACANVPNPILLNLTPPPDIGAITGSDLANAGTNLDARVAASRVAADYIVEVTSQRTANQVPPQLPGVQPTLTATVELKVTTWTPTIAPLEVAT